MMKIISLDDVDIKIPKKTMRGSSDQPSTLQRTEAISPEEKKKEESI